MDKSSQNMLKYIMDKGGVNVNLREKYFFSFKVIHDTYLYLKENGYITGNDNYIVSITEKGKKELNK